MDKKTVKGGTKASEQVQDVTRRDFLNLTTASLAALGGAAVAWPLISSLSPSADVLALGSIEVNVSSVKPGQTIMVKWRGKPVFIRNRLPSEIEEMEKTDLSSLPDPEADSARVKQGKEQWLVTIGICTHLGCVPLANEGEYGGWFCPCHGSHYDKSGRIRKGPAPTNLVVPEYAFLSDEVIKIG